MALFPHDAFRKVTGLALVGALGLACPLALSGCGCSGPASEEVQQEEQDAADISAPEGGSANGEASSGESQTIGNASFANQEGDGRLDLLVLVNRDHALPDGWEDKLDLVEVVNPKGDTVQLDRIAYDAFLELQEDLADQGVTIELNSGYRSIAQQQAIWDEFMEDYGEEYVLEFVAEPGHSEHHTGIALDAYLILDGVPQLTNEEIYAAQDTWDIIHAALPEHGFILRYLPDQEDITGYTYEPWHYRYVGEKAAREIYARGCTLEEYLGE